MAEIFISYARTDRDYARRLASYLEDAGLSVWWDMSLKPGEVFRDEIERRIGEARHVIVLWSEASVKSHFVLDEAGEAAQQGKLVPVRIDGCKLPYGFGQHHTLTANKWPGDLAPVLAAVGVAPVGVTPSNPSSSSAKITQISSNGGSVTFKEMAVPRAAPPRQMPDAPGNPVQVSSGNGGRPAPQRRGASPARHHIAANDDMRFIGGLIDALQQRPSRTPFLIALIASAIWFVLGLGVSYAVFPKAMDSSGSTADMLANPAVIAVVATVVIPIALFWLLAIIIWRAQELRLMSSAMTEAAVHLAEPDSMAEQSVASSGQTVRRQGEAPS